MDMNARLLMKAVIARSKACNSLRLHKSHHPVDTIVTHCTSDLVVTLDHLEITRGSVASLENPSLISLFSSLCQ